MGITEDMKTFKEFLQTDEAMSMATRMKMKAAFRKNKAKIAIGRKKAAKRLASPEKLKSRAVKQARNLIIKKILKGKDKSELSFAARGDLEKKVSKKKGKIMKLAKRLLPAVKKADKAKLRKD